MKKFLLTTVVVFFASIIAINAQEEKKEKVHLKIITKENGKVTEIDTVFEGTDKDGNYYFGDIDGKDFNLDSILTEFKIEAHNGMKYITISDKFHSMDSLKQLCEKIDVHMLGDSVKMKKLIYVMEDGDKKLIECKEGNVFFHGKDENIKIVKSKSGEKMMFTITEDIDIKDHDGVKHVVVTKKHDGDQDEKHIMYTIHENIEGDSVKMKKMMFISEDGEKKLVESKEGMVFISSDSDKDGEHVFVHSDGKKVKIIEGGDAKTMVWTSKDEGDLKLTKEGNVIIYKTGDTTVDILKSEDGEHKIIKKVIVNKDGNVEKNIEVIISDDGEHSIVELIGEDGDLKNIEENVKIYKYKTEDGNITIKADINIEDDGKNVEKEFRKIKISPNPTEGKFNLDFELSNKESVVVKVNNEDGKTVYTKKVKKFKGKFSKEIDISKEKAGTYIIQIIQGDKTIEQILQKK